MDFDLSKENIQPLRKGRNVHQLEIALQAQTDPEIQQQLQQQKEWEKSSFFRFFQVDFGVISSHFEHLIHTYQGEDPLQHYYDYIGWIEQTYPKNGHEGNCVGLLEHCLAKFEDDPRYTNDSRLCKLWIKYVSTFSIFEVIGSILVKKWCFLSFFPWICGRLRGKTQQIVKSVTKMWNSLFFASFSLFSGFLFLFEWFTEVSPIFLPNLTKFLWFF